LYDFLKTKIDSTSDIEDIENLMLAIQEGFNDSQDLEYYLGQRYAEFSYEIAKVENEPFVPRRIDKHDIYLALSNFVDEDFGDGRVVESFKTHINTLRKDAFYHYFLNYIDWYITKEINKDPSNAAEIARKCYLDIKKDTFNTGDDLNKYLLLITDKGHDREMYDIILKKINDLDYSTQRMQLAEARLEEDNSIVEQLQKDFIVYQDEAWKLQRELLELPEFDSSEWPGTEVHVFDPPPPPPPQSPEMQAAEIEYQKLTPDKKFFVWSQLQLPEGTPLTEEQQQTFIELVQSQTGPP
jgi:hypothetical protein